MNNTTSIRDMAIQGLRKTVNELEADNDRLSAENERLRDALRALDSIHPETGNDPLLQALLDDARAALGVQS